MSTNPLSSSSSSSSVVSSASSSSSSQSSIMQSSSSSTSSVSSSQDSVVMTAEGDRALRVLDRIIISNFAQENISLHERWGILNAAEESINQLSDDSLDSSIPLDERVFLSSRTATAYDQERESIWRREGLEKMFINPIFIKQSDSDDDPELQTEKNTQLPIPHIQIFQADKLFSKLYDNYVLGEG